MITDAELTAYNKEGLIPGPNETEEAYLRRVTYCLTLKNALHERLGFEFPLTACETNPTLWHNAWETTEELYCMQPSWIPLFFSNSGLPFWQGGCAWIFQQEEDTPTSAFLQLRHSFKHSPTYLGLYHRDELLAHEMAHVGRMSFDEPEFEEVLAYRSSPSRLRRWLGPLIQAPWESALLVLLLFTTILLDIIAFSFQPELLSQVAWFKLLPLVFIAYVIYRVYRRQQVLKKTLGLLTEAFGGPESGNAILYRLTDVEMRTFAQMTPQALLEYAQVQKETSLRWRSNLLIVSL